MGTSLLNHSEETEELQQDYFTTPLVANVITELHLVFCVTTWHIFSTKQVHYNQAGEVKGTLTLLNSPTSLPNSTGCTLKICLAPRR